MILKLRPYPVYRDFGIPWLGRVPKHWDVQRIKRIARLNPSKSEVPIALRKDQAVFLPMARIGTDGGFEASEVRPVSELWNGFTYFRKGDVIVAKITPCFENGKGASLDDLPTAIGFGSTELHVIRPSKAIVSAYLYRVTTLSEFRRLGADEMTGAAGQQRVPVEFISNFPIPVPSQKEQTAIVRFLDYADRRIRRVIRARQRRIKLLEEYKQALIHRTVTGQIDVRTGKPYPAYKDSGVEWLGQVPAHWEVRRLKSAVANINQQTSAKRPDDLYIALENVESWTGRLLATPSDPQFESQVKRFRAGDVLFGKLRPYLAKVVRPNLDGVCVGEFLVLRSSQAIKPEYLELALRSPAVIDYVNSSTYGAKMPRAEWVFIRNILFPIPPTIEQTAIVEYLNVLTAKIDTIIAASHREIDLLREYRERLIADVVTGKVDVREVAAQLPEEPPEEIELMEEDEFAESKEENKGEDDALTEEISEEDDR